MHTHTITHSDSHAHSHSHSLMNSHTYTQTHTYTLIITQTLPEKEMKRVFPRYIVKRGKCLASSNIGKGEKDYFETICMECSTSVTKVKYSKELIVFVARW